MMVDQGVPYATKNPASKRDGIALPKPLTLSSQIKSLSKLNHIADNNKSL